MESETQTKRGIWKYILWSIAVYVAVGPLFAALAIHHCNNTDNWAWILLVSVIWLPVMPLYEVLNLVP